MLMEKFALAVNVPGSVTFTQKMPGPTSLFETCGAAPAVTLGMTVAEQAVPLGAPIPIWMARSDGAPAMVRVNSVNDTVPFTGTTKE